MNDYVTDRLDKKSTFISRDNHFYKCKQVMDFFTLVGLIASLYFLTYAICLWFTDCDLHLAFSEKFGKKLVKLRGKVIWITEASSELGKMMAITAARESGKLALSSNSPSELEKVKTSCLKSNSFMRTRDILTLEFDVEDVKSHKVVLGKVLKYFGTLDILIMNEDNWERGSWEETLDTKDRLLFQSNLFGVLSLSRLVVRYFNSKQKGKLAVISSIAGLIGVPYSGCYSGTKHALHGYFDGLRFEKIGENIKATLLCLGSSDLTQGKFSKKGNKFLDPQARSRKKMTGERCAHLCLTAIVNELDEAWMAVFPILPLIYAIKYFPNFTKSLLKYLKPKELFQISIESIPLEYLLVPRFTEVQSLFLSQRNKKKMNETWRKLKVCKADLQLEPTLSGGQSFRWKNTEADNWIGVFKDKVWVLSQEDNYLLYKTYNIKSEKPNVSSDKEIEDMLKKYFRLDIDLSNYYKIWSEADPYFKVAAPKLFGIRILKQDVVENVFSFICSTNNNIKRISLMIEKLCKLYGEDIAEVNDETYKSFPTVEKLSGDTVESDLRKAGFGYRAKFIFQTACNIKKMGGSVWLEKLKLLPYEEAKKELIKLPGIGAKVADCICLMSLGHLEAVPVDTHIFQVASNTYLPHLKIYKTLNDKVYKEISDHFRSLHGPYAGWANTVIFCSDLKVFQKNKTKKKKKV